ncbi:F-box/FBD/LRR-repeat protein At1g51370-like [Mercurialis annua]|uniref:F-box/FBD/LRR-repeat protein At1g51370-like n=1 Tax=Mercurialis annua TaxID=3986 RepID=UPI00215EA44D|nr:F-box/FBD/LRR-repeat protein At1g51370-like [Mercurialis annua]
MNKDRISKLPEGIHGEILSYLSAKDAAKTSVLSRSWRHTWSTSLASLDLPSPFVDFVNRPLRVHSFPFIKRFRLKVGGYCPSPILKSWIEAAVSYKIQELDLCVQQRRFLVPGHLFSCESLKVLKLRGWECFIGTSCLPETITESQDPSS